MSEMQREVREITSTGEWLAWRRNDITASRVAALFSAHPYLTLDSLVADLRGQSQGSNAAMRRGRILEPAVIAALAEDHPDWPPMVKAVTYHRLPDHRLGATPDYWLGDDGLIQCKTVSPTKWEEWQNRPPLAYTLQTLTEMLVTNKQRGVLAVLVTSPSYPVYEFVVERHDAAEARILDAVAAFWAAWDAGEIAAPAPVEDLSAMLDDGTHRDLSGDNALPGLLTERRALKAEAATTERRLKEIDYEIKNRIGPASTAWLPGWAISFRRQHRKEHVIPAADVRVLRIKEIAEEIE